jgi:hypothetical protein
MSQGLATPFLATTTPTTTVYTSGSGTYTTPNNVQFLIVEVLGGGGGGGGAASANATQVGTGAGGGAGGYAQLLITSPAASYSYAVGAGGTAGASGANAGGTGGTTTFGPSLQATGGAGGAGGVATGTTSGLALRGGLGGVGSNGTFNCNGAPGLNSLNIIGLVYGGSGGSPLYGGGGSALAGAIGAGSAGTNYGAGGAGATANNGNQAGGAGSGGLIVITEYYNVLGVSSNLNLPLTVDQGGTGRTSATAYGVICGGTTSTGAQQSIASVGTSGQVLTSNGAGALPTFQSIITDWVAYTPTFTGFGTVSNVEVWSRRIGDTLYIRGVVTSGTPTATEARMTLGYNGTNSNVTSSSTKITSIQFAGCFIYTSAGAAMTNTLIESNKGYITFGSQQVGSGLGGRTKLNGDAIVGASSTVSFTAEVPIASFP